MMRLIVFNVFAMCSLQIGTLYSQAVGIGNTVVNPDPSSILELRATDRGFLMPRMTQTQRDAIVNPAEGLFIFNLTTHCPNYFANGSWWEYCGTCSPAPSIANAGPDQLNVSGTTATLAATAPMQGKGSWSIVSGSGGSFGNANVSNTSFTGTAGTTYTLRWTVSNACGSTQDQVTISFQSVVTLKRVFVSSVTVSGNMGGVAGADNFCQNRANAAGLGGTWKAWLSSSTQSVASRFTQFNGPYRLIDNTLIANNWADLTDGSIQNPINKTEFGATTSNGAVWTHTTVSGNSATTSASQVCSDWTVSTSGNTLIHCAGSPFQTNQDWTAGYSGCAYPCNGNFPLFCFEQ